MLEVARGWSTEAPNPNHLTPKLQALHKQGLRVQLGTAPGPEPLNPKTDRNQRLEDLSFNRNLVSLASLASCSAVEALNKTREGFSGLGL